MDGRIFKRKIYDKLLEWKTNSNGSTALLIEGARRVGKSTVAEQFAKNEYDSYILVDFNKVSASIKKLFEDLTDLNYIFITLQTQFHVSLHTRKSLIIFDEVQKCPLARQAIKYLVQDGRYDYLETGSLISIKQNTKGITIPSEEERISMYPMDYEEFRWALGDTATLPLLRQLWELQRPIGASHRVLSRDFRLYMLVGGMPQAVNAYIDTNDLSKVDAVKRNIITLYNDDFKKIDPSGRARKMFMSIPGQLNRNMVRYVPYSVVGEVEESVMSTLLTDLEDSRTVLFAHHVDDPNIGMGLTENLTQYKMFTCDTGLFITLAFWEKSFVENTIYQKLLLDKLPANLGYVYENMVAQILVTGGDRLFYHTWPKDDKHYYEVDFLLSRGSKLCPLEVKSSTNKSHASLDEFCRKYSSRISRRYLICSKDFQKDTQTSIVPIYMAECL